MSTEAWLAADQAETADRLRKLEQENAWMVAKLADVEWLSWNCCDDCGTLIRAELNKARGGQR